MPIVTTKEILTPPPRKWGVGAFGVHNMEDVQAVIWAAEEAQSPVIIQVTESGLRYAGAPYIASIVKTAGELTNIPVALQLDHGRSFAVALECMRLGFSSVMIDGSHLPFQENIALTKKVVNAAKDYGVSVEGELGMIGGKEDNVSVGEEATALTDPDLAAEFVEATGIDILAPAVGTQHGFYRGEPQVDLELLKKIREKVSIPLALHGASGLPANIIQAVISIGVGKINVATELKLAVTDGFRAYFRENPGEYESRRVLAFVRNRVKQLVLEKISEFNSVGKAKITGVTN